MMLLSQFWVVKILIDRGLGPLGLNENCYAGHLYCDVRPKYDKGGLFGAACSELKKWKP